MRALYQIWYIKSDGITLGQVCPFKYPTFLVGDLPLKDYQNWPLTEKGAITCVMESKEILVIPLFPYCNLTVAFIGILRNFRSSYNATSSRNQRMTLEGYIRYAFDQTDSIDFHSMFERNRYMQDMIHEISIYTQEIRLIQPEHELVLQPDKNRPERLNCETIETWADSDQNLTPCYTFSARNMFDNLIFLIKKANATDYNNHPCWVDELDYNQPITQGHLDGDTPPKPVYRKQPWEIISSIQHQSQLYHKRLPEYFPPARQVVQQPAQLPQTVPTAQISFIQYISNSLTRFVQFICPNI